MADQVPDITKEHLIETYRSMVTVGSGALKASLLLNGGAVVALLALLGSILGNLSYTATSVPDLVWPIVVLVFGLFLGAAAHTTVYMTQITLYNEGLYPNRMTGIWGRHRIWLRISMGLVVFSYAAFGAGALWAVVAFGSAASSSVST